MAKRKAGVEVEEPESGADDQLELLGQPAAGDTEPALESSAESEPPEETAAELRVRLQEERETRIRLEERLAARDAAAAPAQTPAPAAAKVFSRAQLRAAVQEGQIDDDQMEEIWARQQREMGTRETLSAIDARENKRTVESRVETGKSQYMEAFPDLLNRDSETWKRVKREYDFLIKVGDADNPTTELKALRAALGPVERIRERTSRLRETPRETGSHGSGGGRPVDIFNRIPVKYRSHYKRMYEEGRMKLADIEKDLKYMGTTS